jgi:hypothetical protein
MGTCGDDVAPCRSRLNFLRRDSILAALIVLGSFGGEKATIKLRSNRGRIKRR